MSSYYQRHHLCYHLNCRDQHINALTSSSLIPSGTLRQKDNHIHDSINVTLSRSRHAITSYNISMTSPTHLTPHHHAIFPHDRHITAIVSTSNPRHHTSTRNQLSMLDSPLPFSGYLHTTSWGVVQRSMGSFLVSDQPVPVSVYPCYGCPCFVPR